MLLQKSLKMLGAFLVAGVMLGGCSSMVFPDFEDDNSEVIIHEGGKVEIRKVNEDGVLVSDKENAAYEDENEAEGAEEKTEETEDKKAEVEQVMPARTVEVKKESIEPIEDDSTKVAKGKTDESTKAAPKEDKVPTMHYLAATIYFENGGAVVGSSYNKILRNIAKLVKENDAMVTVYGFASSRTRDTDPVSHKLANFNVSAERAQNTAKALRRMGVPADNIITQALSDSMPLYQEVMPEGERLNRRAEIYLTY